MNLKKIMRLCRAAKECYILRNPVTGKQWIGTREAIYPVEGFDVDADMIPYLFDLTEADRKDWVIQESAGVVPEIELTEQDARVQCWARITVRRNNEDYVPLVQLDAAGQVVRVWWVRADAIGPAQEKDKPLDYRMRGNIALFGVGLLVNGACVTLDDKEAVEITERLRSIAGGASAWREN